MKNKKYFLFMFYIFIFTILIILLLLEFIFFPLMKINKFEVPSVSKVKENIAQTIEKEITSKDIITENNFTENNNKEQIIIDFKKNENQIIDEAQIESKNEEKIEVQKEEEKFIISLKNALLSGNFTLQRLSEINLDIPEISGDNIKGKTADEVIEIISRHFLPQTQEDEYKIILRKIKTGNISLRKISETNFGIPEVSGENINGKTVDEVIEILSKYFFPKTQEDKYRNILRKIKINEISLSQVSEIDFGIPEISGDNIKGKTVYEIIEILSQDFFPQSIEDYQTIFLNRIKTGKIKLQQISEMEFQNPEIKSEIIKGKSVDEVIEIFKNYFSKMKEKQNKKIYSNSYKPISHSQIKSKIEPKSFLNEFEQELCFGIGALLGMGGIPFI